MEAERCYESVYTNIHGETLRFQYFIDTDKAYLLVDGLQLPVINGEAPGAVLHPLERVWLGLVSFTATEFKFSRDTYVPARS